MELCIKSNEVISDIRSAAWLEQELHPELDRHRRHQMADICEKDNVECVWRVLGVAMAELRLALGRMLRQEKEIREVNDLDSPEEWNFGFLLHLPSSTLDFLREKIHEYLVASVMADRGAVIIPACAGIWRERAETALAELRALAATSGYKPARRPIWPL
ncbi:MAG: hypothetical protein K2H72_07430 [Muribaculaceae bacterium]|nr:hypothetical protein [Muribaculaceae bacterium]